MKGKEVKFYWRDVRENTDYDEDIAIPPTEPDAETYIKRVLVEYNAEEDRRHEKNPEYKSCHRAFIRLGSETGKEKEILIHCDLFKVNMVTIVRGNDVYDVMECKNCHYCIRRFSIETPEPYCFPDRTCAKCNKIFTSAKNLALHNKRDNHHLPDWYPDGV